MAKAIKDLSKAELIELVQELIEKIPSTDEVAKQPKESKKGYSRTLKDCLTTCQTDKSPKPTEFAKTNKIKVRTQGESERADEARRNR